MDGSSIIITIIIIDYVFTLKARGASSTVGADADAAVVSERAVPFE